VNDYINAGTNPSLEVSSNLTLEAWIKPQYQTNGVILSREGEYLLWIDGNNQLYWLFANTNPAWANWTQGLTGYAVSLNEWTHIAVTYENGLIKTYANGKLVHTYDGGGTIGDYVANQDEFRIGNRQWNNVSPFKGQIDEVKVWNVTRTQAEIQANLNQKLTGNEQGLAGYWNFEETTGNTVNDLTTNKNNGTLISGIQRTVANSNPITRPEGKALYFDGVNDYINAGTNPSLEVTNTLTIEAWIKPQQNSQQGVIVSREGEYRLAIGTENTIYFAIANSNPSWTWVNTGAKINLNQWNHIALTYDKGLIKTYVGGELVYSYDGAGVIGDYSLHASQDDLRIGNRQWYNLDTFKGEIDEVRVWNVAKTQAEIQANLNQKLTGNEQGLVGYWNFEETTGNTVNDLTANKNNGTLINGVQRTVANSNPITRPEGKALFFDGVNDSVKIADSPNLNPTKITIEAWVKSSNWAGQTHPAIVAKGINEEYLLWKSNDAVGNEKFAFRLGRNIVTVYGSTTVQNDVWYHVAATYDGNEVKLYVNGSLEGIQSIATVIPDGVNPVTIGGGVNSNYLRGNIDEVRIWNVARTQAEIQASLNQKLSGNEQGLIGYWNLEENSGNTVYDLTTNKNNGTLINGVQRTIDSSIAVPQIVDGQTNLIESKTIANLQTLRLETAYLTLISQQNPDKAQQYLQEYQASDKIEAILQTFLNKYFPELNNTATLATLQQ